MTQLLSDQQRILGPDHPSTLITRNLGACLGWKDQVDEAFEVFSQVLLDRERVLGANHPDTLVTRSNLAVCLSRSGRIAEAIELQTQLLSGRERILGPDHPIHFVHPEVTCLPPGAAKRLSAARFEPAEPPR